jgi:hypothetical protein
MVWWLAGKLLQRQGHVVSVVDLGDTLALSLDEIGPISLPAITDDDVKNAMTSGYGSNGERHLTTYSGNQRANFDEFCGQMLSIITTPEIGGLGYAGMTSSAGKWEQQKCPERLLQLALIALMRNRRAVVIGGPKKDGGQGDILREFWRGGPGSWLCDVEIQIGDHVARWRSSAIIPKKPLLYRAFRPVNISAA